MTLVEPHHHPLAKPNGAAVAGRDPACLPVALLAAGSRPTGGGTSIVLTPSLACLADPSVLERTRRRVEETTDSYRDIGAAIGAPASTLGGFARRMGWRRPPGAPKPHPASPGRRPLAQSLADAGDVQARILRAVDRQVGKIEARSRKPGAEIEEKDSRILGALAKTLQTLMALDRDDGAKAKDMEPVDRGELRAELARRIAAWAAEGNREREEPA